MRQNVKNGANVKNVKIFAETWYVKKTLVILAQMGQMLRIEKAAPLYKMGHVEKKMPQKARIKGPKNSQILAILSQNILGGGRRIRPMM